MAWHGSKYIQAIRSDSHGQVTHAEILSRLPYNGMIIDFHMAFKLNVQKNSEVGCSVCQAAIREFRATPCQAMKYLAYCRFTFVAFPGIFHLKRMNGFTLRSVPR